MEISRQVLVFLCMHMFYKKSCSLLEPGLDRDYLITVHTEVICKVLISEINALQSNKYLMLPSAAFKLVTNPARWSLWNSYLLLT